MQQALGFARWEKAGILAVLAAFASAGALPAQTIGSFDFSASSQLTGNFVTQQATGQALAVNTTSQQLVQTGTTSGAVDWVYDTPPDATPSNASFQNFTVSLNFTLGNANSSIGVYFYDGGNRTNSLLALFNVNSSGSDDIIRFFSGANINGVAAGSPVGTTSTLAAGGYTTGQAYLETLTVASLGSNQVQATLTISDPNNVLTPFSATYTYAGITAAGGEIGFRAALGAAGTNSFDNVVATVPEPASLSLLGLPVAAGVAGRLLRRRRS